MAIVSNDYPTVKGLIQEPVILKPNALSTAKIPAGATVVTVGTNVNNVNDWIVLPKLSSVKNGHTIRIVCNAAGHEIRTEASSNEKINNVDSDGGAAEYTVPAGSQIHYFTKISDTVGWEAHGFTAIGAAVGAITPDA
jgi:hypothetical protein